MRAKLVRENLNESLEFTDADYIQMLKKLEYRFKKSGHNLVEKIKNKEHLSDEELSLLLKKFEYTFRKSEPELIIKMKKHLGLEKQSNIKFSNLKAHQTKLKREKEKKSNK